MILLRKPITIFDVDLIGAVMVGVVGVIAFVTVLVPSRSVSQIDQQLSVAVQATQDAIARSSNRLDRALESKQELARKVEARERTLPTPGDASDFPRQIAAAAENHGVTVQQLAPNPLRAAEQGLVCDVHVVARSGLSQFIAMLDELRGTCPHMQVREFAIARGPDATQPESTLSLTLRMYLSPTSAGGKP